MRGDGGGGEGREAPRRARPLPWPGPPPPVAEEPRGFPLLTAAEMGEADRHAIAARGIPGRVLMELAGAGCARSALARWPECLDRAGVLVLAGRGNNGGDGFVVARHLASRGVAARVLVVGDPGTVAGDARANLDLLAAVGVPVNGLISAPDLARVEAAVASAGVVVDALFGTGLARGVSGLAGDVIGLLAGSRAPVLSVDLPSGVDATTGAAPGAAVRADVTVTFAAPKWGHFLFPGASLRGELEVVDIGIPYGDLVDRAHGRVLGPDLYRWLPPGRPDAHKGSFGHLLVVAGSTGKPGAAVLAALGALRAGAGLVTLAVPEGVASRLPGLPPEVMVEEVLGEGGAFSTGSSGRLAALRAGKDAFALGPGLGRGPGTVALAREAVASWGLPGVVDADGLYALAGDPTPLSAAPRARLITPHSAEAGRLLGRSAAGVDADRPGSVRALAALGPQVVALLKGAGSLVAAGDRPVALVAAGNPGMASGGTGDVLTGIAGALLASGLPASVAAPIAAAWHAAAGDRARLARGERSLAATDLAAFLGEAVEASRAGALAEPFAWR